jgi:hypothetical protein
MALHHEGHRQRPRQVDEDDAMCAAARLSGRQLLWAIAGTPSIGASLIAGGTLVVSGALDACITFPSDTSS